MTEVESKEEKMCVKTERTREVENGDKKSREEIQTMKEDDDNIIKSVENICDTVFVKCEVNNLEMEAEEIENENWNTFHSFVEDKIICSSSDRDTIEPDYTSRENRNEINDIASNENEQSVGIFPTPPKIFQNELANNLNNFIVSSAVNGATFKKSCTENDMKKTEILLKNIQHINSSSFGNVLPSNESRINSSGSIECSIHCVKCKKVFKVGDLLNHRCTADYQHQCPACNKMFKSDAFLKHHMAIHTGESEHKCEICGKIFAVRSNLVSHLLVHSSERKHGCKICGRGFKSRSNLNTHSLIHSTDRKYKCEVCGKCFKQSGNLYTHTSLHTMGRNHKCHICGKTFAQKGNLHSHLLVHTNQRNFKCEICEKTFLRKADLVSHTMAHVTEGYHKCETCGKSFKHKTSLAGHVLLHTGEKNHRCEFCGKFFRLRKLLREHWKVHTRERKYKCEICLKSFTKSHNLKKHTLLHKKHNSENNMQHIGGNSENVYILGLAV